MSWLKIQLLLLKLPLISISENVNYAKSKWEYVITSTVSRCRGSK